MPYFQRPSVDHAVTPVQRPSVPAPRRTSIAPHPRPVVVAPPPGILSIVERASAILAGEPSSKEGISPSPSPSLPDGWFALAQQGVFNQDDPRERALKLVESIVGMVAQGGWGQELASKLSKSSSGPLSLPPVSAGDGHHSGDVAQLAAEPPQAPGGTATALLTLANDDESPVTLAFRATDLLSNDGIVIPAAQVSFTPVEITLASRARGTVGIRIAVPPGARAGAYAGLVQAVGEDEVRFVISMEVTG
jgi:hypothetical protein